MKLRIGLPPEDASFDSKVGDWQLFREPGMTSLQFLGIGVAGLTTLILVGSLLLVYGKAVSQVSFIVVGTVIIAITPVHEMIHAVFLPSSLLSEQVTFGFSVRPLGCYTSYSGELDKRRFLLVAVGPFVVLTLVPLVSMLVARMWSPLLVEIALANGMCSPLDLIYFFLACQGIPNGARVKTSGMKTYWRRAAYARPQ
jgi:hypothetical protein